jgi:polyhydroxyalkanoate synthase
MARAKDNRLNSINLLAAQGDFTEAGELKLFIDESQLSFLESSMWEKGYLDSSQMAGTFQMLRSYDFIWAKMIQNYLGGSERGMIDLMAWNADATRMPYKMHKEYLEKLFLNNDLTAGRFVLDGHVVAAENIQVPAFVVGTEKDHVAPWKSVYKAHLMIHQPLTFVLANGGHNAGIVSEPGHAGRYYRIHERNMGDAFMGPDEWVQSATKVDGSWWIALHAFLAQRNTTQVPARLIDATLPKAPGTYVFQK